MFRRTFSCFVLSAFLAGGAFSGSISISDNPVGYAKISANAKKSVTVTNRQELLNALKKGGVIFVQGDIDMTDGMLPSEAGGSTAALDSFVSKNSSFKTYEEYKKAYAADCTFSTNDKSSSKIESSVGKTTWKLSASYSNLISLKVKSNTTIIGLEGATIRGGSLKIRGVSNVAIRNLTILDAYDPFPHHEDDDGFNAEHDAIVIDSSSDIWIDHCTVGDTMKYQKVVIKDGNEEKWQTYDGLCDIKNGAKNVVVSYCVFQNHDKTILIGSSNKDTAGGRISIHHNRFINCGQRLPLTTYPEMHIFNNSYERTADAFYKQQACIAARYGAYSIIAENNNFGEGVEKTIIASTKAAGKCYESGNIFTSGKPTLETQSTKPFSPSYQYSLDDATEIPNILKSQAGVGSVSK